MKRAGISLFDTHRVFCFICASDANATFSPVSTLASPSHGEGLSSLIPRCECGLPGLLVEFGRTPGIMASLPTLLLYRRANPEIC